jgi:protein phosphatase
MTFHIRTSAFTIPGIAKQNEDCYLVQVLPNGNHVIAVADGVGGHHGGAIASALAIRVAIDALLADPEAELGEVFERVSETLRSKGAEDLISSQMATTLTVCVISQNGSAKLGHVGDSRAYHLRGKGVIQRTSDQTEVAALVEAGILSKEQARTYPRRTVLTSALSSKGSFTFEERSFDVVIGDRLILLTDGVYRIVSKLDFRDISTESPSPEAFAESVKAVIDGVNDDDATAVFAQLDTA